VFDDQPTTGRENETRATMSEPDEYPEVDEAILAFLDSREATYLAVMAQELSFPVALLKGRCHWLAERGLLDRESNTYYAITEAGRRRLDGETE